MMHLKMMLSGRPTVKKSNYFEMLNHISIELGRELRSEETAIQHLALH